MRSLVLALTGACLASSCGDDEGFKLGALGMIEIDPPAVDFILEQVDVGASVERIVRVRNLGAAELRIEDARMEVLDTLGASPVSVSLKASPPLFVPADPSAFHELTLRFTRIDSVPRRLALVVQSSDPERRIVKVPVGVRRGVADLLAIPAQASFQDGVALPASQTLRLVNAGTAPLTLGRMRLDAEASFEVSLAGARVGGATGAFEVALTALVPAGGELPLEVRFAPDHREPVAGTLTLFGDSANSVAGFPIPLFGNQSGPCILVRPSVMVFGEKPADTVTELPAEIENCGPVPLMVTGIALATAEDEADPELMAAGAEASSPRLSLTSAGLPAAGAPWNLEPAEVREVRVSYRAWTTAELADGLAASEDRGALMVRSSSSLPLRVVPIRAATAAPVVPTDIAGCEWLGGTVVKHPVEVQMTADDAYEVWVDGAPLARDEGVWRDIDTYAFELDSGCHVLGVHAWDMHSVRSGLIALIRVDGEVRWTSGDAKPEWSVSGPDAPPAGWHELLFDDGVWTEPRACASTSIWGTVVSGLEAQGARWVWWNTDCNDLSNAYFRLTFTVD